MRHATELLVQYAAYHRDRRNIATHFIGVPLIVFAVGVLLARPVSPWGAWPVTPAGLALGLAAAWYLTRGVASLGAATTAATALLVLAGHWVSTHHGTVGWLAWGVGGFLAGWLIQFVGHYYEGRKPAFVDDVVGLLVAPMFVTAEALFAVGWNPRLAQEIERRAGPTGYRDLHYAAAVGR
jgi:uncharacterized membrane protein YGL010W